MNTNEEKDKIGDLIEELKRIQIEHGNIPFRKTDDKSQLSSIWPKLKEIKEINNQVFVVF